MAFDDDIFGTGNPAGFIKGLIGDEVGPTAGLRAFREAGGEIQDSRWFDLYGQVSDTLAREPGVLAFEPGALPGPSDYGVWSVKGPGGQYATQVEVQIRDRDTGNWYTKQHTYITDDPHTPEEAEADAFDMFGDPDTENDYGETVMGALAVHLWRTEGA